MNAAASQVGSEGQDACNVCGKSLPKGAMICTECESWQFTRRFLTLTAKVAFVLVVPMAAWLISVFYQSREHSRGATQDSLKQTIEETSQILALASDFQVALDRLTVTCSKDTYQSNNLCLAEDVDRIIRLNELVNRFSWKCASLPLPEDAMNTLRRWKGVWWNTTAPALKRQFAAMAKPSEKNNGESKLLDCQKFDFADSECGGVIRDTVGEFRTETIAVMCHVFVDMEGHVLALYDSLPRDEVTKNLARVAKKNLETSECVAIIGKSRPTLAANSE